MSQVLVAIMASTSPYVESLEPAAVPWFGAQLFELQPCPAWALGEKLRIAVGMAYVVWLAWGVEKNVDVA